MNTYNYTVYIGNRDESRSFTYSLSEEGERVKKLCDDLEEKDVWICYENDTPESWDEWSYKEQKEWYKENLVDLRILSLVFRWDHSGISNDLLQFRGIPTVDSILIHDGNINEEDIQIIESFPNLNILLLRGKQFTDKIIPSILKCKKLQSLDLFGTAVTIDGVQKIKNHLTVEVFADGI